MASSRRLFRGATGLNTKDDPARIGFDQRTGVQELAVAVNVDIEQNGMVRRRPGFQRRITGSWHSVYGAGGYFLGVRGNALCAIDHNFSYRAIRSVTEGKRMRYVTAHDGKSPAHYYTNGDQIGIVKNRISYEWAEGTAYLQETTRTLSGPPTGHLLEIWNGRMWIAVDNAVFYSQPFGFNLYRLATDYVPFESRIRMLAGVEGGLYVGHDKGVVFLRGQSASDLSLETVSDGAPVEGAVTKVDGSRFMDGGNKGPVALWVGSAGVCAGTGDGRVSHLTRHRFDVPSGRYGSALARSSGQIVFTIEA